MVAFAGKYTRSAIDNYDQFAEKVGMTADKIKAVKDGESTMEISEDGGKWSVTTKNALRTHTRNFEFGKQFDDQTPAGKECVATITKSGDDTWEMNMSTKEGNKTLKMVRKFSDAGINDEFDFEGVVAKITWKRQ